MKHPLVITSSIYEEKTACVMIALYDRRIPRISYENIFPIFSLLKAIFISHVILLRKAPAKKKKMLFKCDYFR